MLEGNFLSLHGVHIPSDVDFIFSYISFCCFRPDIFICSLMTLSVLCTNKINIDINLRRTKRPQYQTYEIQVICCYVCCQMLRLKRFVLATPFICIVNDNTQQIYSFNYLITFIKIIRMYP